MNHLPYGTWPSPITPDLITAATVGLGDVALANDAVYWVEYRPNEAGRAVLVRRDAQGHTHDLTPAPFSILTRVHEYGGGAFAVHDGTVYFVNDQDQGLYLQTGEAAPLPLLVSSGLRHADLLVDPHHHWLIAVREDHRTGTEPENTLVAIDLHKAPGAERVLATGADFYASPTLSHDGTQLAWLAWNHPNMPWDGTELWLADLSADGHLHHARRVAGGVDESIFQPQWGPDGALYFISDRSGWWNLYRWQDDVITPLCPRAAEFGLPQWVFSQSTYGFANQELICAYSEQGLWTLAQRQPDSTLAAFTLPYSQISEVQCAPGKVVFLGGSPSHETVLVEFNLASHTLTTLRRSSTTYVDPGYLATPEPIVFPTSGGRSAHAFFYPPTNKDCRAPDGERPPLLIKSHGGPTSASNAVLNLGIQYWTSRGFAVLDVNYGGSSGYGRDYRRQLDGQWGVVDVDDCVAAARYVIDQGRADGARCAIRGNSAGGYTTLAALAFRNLFKAGASYYGVSDLETLAQDTHKFESRYLDRLIGPYPAAQEIYIARSPIHHLEGLNAPVIFFQGLEDKVVPPAQAERMVAALRAQGVPVAYVPFAGERHGFRRAENIQRALEAELYFYGQIFGFVPADTIEPVVIDNLT